MRGFSVIVGAAVVGTVVCSGCSASGRRSTALADSEIVAQPSDLGYASEGALAIAGDGVGLWLLGAAEGETVGPLVLAMNVHGRPTFVAGDALGMMLLTGNISALANVLEETTPTE